MTDEIEKLKAETASPWQPIETAPKDGTLIIIYEKGFFKCGIGSYSPAWEDWCWLENGDKIDNPTHWMFLPTPPEFKND